MSSARQIVEAVLRQDVVLVFEAGNAMDPWSALYINGKLVVSSPRGDVVDVLEALGIKPRELFVAKGFDGNWPEKLTQLKFVNPT